MNGNLSIYENIGGKNINYNNNFNNNNINNNNSIDNNKIKNPPRPNRKPTRQQRNIEDKLDVSNDDLLEAIEQLSMLSKPRNSMSGIVSSVLETTNNTSATNVQATPKKIISSVDTCNKTNNDVKGQLENDEEDRKKYVEFLQNEKLHILSNMETYKRSVADIETQEEEIDREVIFFFFF